MPSCRSLLTPRFDVLAGSRCGGRMSLVAIILDPAIADKILRYLGLATRAPLAGPAFAADPAASDAPLVE